MFAVLNKNYEVVFKTDNLDKLYEYIKSLYIKKLTDNYVGKELTLKELSSVAYEYRNYDELSSLYYNYECDEIFMDEYIDKLRKHLNSFELLLAY